MATYSQPKHPLSPPSMKLGFKLFIPERYIRLSRAHYCSAKMAFNCAPCHKNFGTENALNQHLRSSARHANGATLSRNATAQASKANKNPRHPNISTSQMGTQSPRPFRCQKCDRSFESQCSLNSHLQDSKAHKFSVVPVVHAEPGLELRLSGPVMAQNNTATQGGAALRNGTTSRCTVPISRHSITENAPKGEPSRWFAIAKSEISGFYEKLSKVCHSQEDLLRNKYVLRPYSGNDIAKLRKCTQCGQLAKDVQNKPCLFHPKNATLQNSQRIYTCCQKPGKGCMSTSAHNFRQACDADKLRAFASSPVASSQQRKLRAVVLDCEMVQIGMRNELIKLCAVDLLSCKVILNKLIRPSGKVRKWRTDIHGITSAHVEEAISQGQALPGWKEAREELWKLIDQDTILIGHALHHDLEVLRIVHSRIVDSAILASAAVGLQNPRWGLEKLYKELVGLEIRTNDGKIHDCLEDVMATREVVLWCLQHKQELEAWGKAKKAEALQKEEARKAARERAETGRSRN